MSRTYYFGTQYKEGDPLRKVSNARETNMANSFIDLLEGVGCRVIKELHDGDKIVCKIVVDGSSDVAMPAGVVSADRKFAVDSIDAAAYGVDQFANDDRSAGYSSGDDLIVSWDVDTSSTRKLRFYVTVDDTTAAPVEVLGRTASGKPVWITLTDTCGA